MIHQPAFQMCYFHMTSNGWIYGVPPVMKIVRDPALSIKTLKFDEDEPVGAHGPMTLSRSDSLSCRRVTTYTWVTLGARQRHSPPNTRSINHRNHRQSTHTLIQRKWALKQLGQRNHNHKNILLLTAIPRMQLANSNARSTTRPAMHLMWGFSFVNNFVFFVNPFLMPGRIHTADGPTSHTLVTSGSGFAVGMVTQFGNAGNAKWDDWRQRKDPGQWGRNLQWGDPASE